MNDFKFTLKLETPLLQGGPAADDLDPTHLLRAPSVRGLLHTFARAMLGPLLDGDPAETRRAEGALLGTAAGERGASATLRVQDISTAPLKSTGQFSNCLHKYKGESPGYLAGQTRTLAIRPRPYAAQENRELPAALWAVAWSAFTFGALGKRCRRGYGGFVIEKGEDLPFDLPLFSDAPADEKDLAMRIRDGFQTARMQLVTWLHAENDRMERLARKSRRTLAAKELFNPREPTSPAPNDHADQFFEIRDLESIRIAWPGRDDTDAKQPVSNMHGMEKLAGMFPDANLARKSPVGWSDSDAAMRALHQASSDAVAANFGHFGQAIGRPRPNKKEDRLASPLWFRPHQLATGKWVFLVCVSPRVARLTASGKPSPIWKSAEEFLESVGATTERSVARLAQ